MRRKWLSGCLAVCVMAMSIVSLPLPAEASPQEAASTTDVDKNGDVHKHTARFNVNAVSLGNAVYYLADDIVMSWQKTIPVNGHATLCLNGHKLDVNGKYLTFTIAKNASLTICDCSTVETKGHINDAGLWEEGESQGNANTANLTGGIITGINGDASFVKCEGTVRFESGNIAGNSINERHGFLVSNHGGTVILDGGTIAGNKGAAMMVADDKSYGHVESGKINNNVADKFVLKNEGALTVRGGELSENKSNLGLIGNTSTGTLLLGGSPIIKDNIGDGNHHTIFLAEKPLVILDGFHPERVIGVGMEHPEVFTKDWNTHMPGSHPAEYFYSEQPGYSISQNDSGEGLFVAGDTYPIIYKDLGGGTFSGELPEGAVKIHQLGTATVLPEPTKNGYVFKGWYTDYTGNGAPLTEIAATYNQTPVVYAKWVEAVQAPIITEQPTDLTLAYGTEGDLSVKASSPTDDTLSYQWYQTADENSTTNATAIDGATKPTLTVGKDAKPGSYYYYCVVTASRDGVSESTTSNVATVTVNKPALQAPSITEQPKNLTLDYGAEGSLSVQATSPTDDALSYQWYRAADESSTTNDTAINGATQSTLTVGKDAKPGSYYYYCVVTASRDGVSESTTSNVATVTVNKPALQAPSITEQPKNLTLDYGAEGSLSVQATSPTDDALSYQWYQTADENSTTNGTSIDGATQSTLTVGKDAKPGSYYYYCVVTASRDGLSASTTSKVATVVVNKPALQAPSITEQPKNLTLDYGAEGSLSVQATSPTDDVLSYQWYRAADKNSTTNATAINGATKPTLTVGKDAKPGSYYYYCVVTASRDTQQLTTTSSIATVTVNKPDLQAPIITEQPTDLTLAYGTEGDLSVKASSPTDDALSYQWYQTADESSTTNGTAINGATQSTLTVGKDAKPGSYYYYCVVTASRDTQQLTTTSSIATVTVNKPDLQAPIITEQPTDLTLAYGAEESLSVQATSPTDDTLSYQWYRAADKNSTTNGTAIDGATKPTLTVGKDAKPGSYYYYCVVTASRDTQQLTTTSSIATVTVNKPSTPPSKPNPQPPVQNPGETVTHPDGSVTTTVTKPNGTTVATTVSPNGDKLILTTYPEGSVEVAVSGTTPRVVTVPVKDVSAGTVPLVTDCNGKQTVVQRSVVTAEGVVLSVNDGDVIEFLHKVPSFADVPDAHWAKDAIIFAWARGLVVGVDDTHFAPEALTTRAMIWSILSRMEGVSSVGGEHWYQPGQEWAMANGVSDGTMPEASITREQLAAMLYRYAGSPDAKGNLSGYRDASMVNDWAQDAMIWAVDEGIVAGMTADTLVPQGTATRAQTAAMLERFISWQLGVQTK